MKKKLIILGILVLVISTSGFGCKRESKEVKEAMQSVTLRFWRVFDGQDAFDEIIAEYRAKYPFINIEYRKLRYEEYEKELLNALAEDRGPDIFSIHNTWIKKYQSKIAPMPRTTTMAYPVVKGTLKKEVSYELRTVNTLSLQDIRDRFVDVVSQDVILEDNQVYGLPLALDTLALFYNKDLLNNAGVSEVPQFWNRDLLQAVKAMTKQDPRRGIIQSGLALGGSSNIERYSDILTLIMMQNGATIVNDSGQVSFHVIPSINRESNYNPGLEALRFYTDFANPIKETYAWNDELDNSIDMFIGGNVAMIFGYSYHVPLIRAAAPRLNFSIAKFPQIEGMPPTNINFANYWVESVSKKSKHPNEAWHFIQFMTSESQVGSYLNKTKKPSALRSLISKQKEDDDIRVFADQVLTARSWYRGANVTAAENAIKEMIDAITSNSSEKLQTIINNAAAKIQQTIY